MSRGTAEHVQEINTQLQRAHAEQAAELQEANKRITGRAGTPTPGGCRIGYTEHTGRHRLNHVLSAK
jgi:hypothetical protein